MSARPSSQVLGALPVRTHWIDSREEVFPAELPLNVRCEHSEPVHGAVPTLEAGSRVLIMSFSHAEDLDIVAACLKRRRERADLPFIGLIGSKSKWATFRHRLEARGFSAAELDARHQPDRRARRGRQGARGHRRRGGGAADAAAHMNADCGLTRSRRIEIKVYTLSCTRRSGAGRPGAFEPALCATQGQVAQSARSGEQPQE